MSTTDSTRKKPPYLYLLSKHWIGALIRLSKFCSGSIRSRCHGSNHAGLDRIFIMVLISDSKEKGICNVRPHQCICYRQILHASLCVTINLYPCSSWISNNNNTHTHAHTLCLLCYSMRFLLFSATFVYCN